MENGAQYLVEDLLNKWFRIGSIILDMKAKQDIESAEYYVYVGMLKGLWSALLSIWKHYPEATNLNNELVMKLRKRKSELMSCIQITFRMTDI